MPGCILFVKHIMSRLSRGDCARMATGLGLVAQGAMEVFTSHGQKIVRDTIRSTGGLPRDVMNSLGTAGKSNPLAPAGANLPDPVSVVKDVAENVGRAAEHASASLEQSAQHLKATLDKAAVDHRVENEREDIESAPSKVQAEASSETKTAEYQQVSSTFVHGAAGNNPIPVEAVFTADQMAENILKPTDRQRTDDKAQRRPDVVHRRERKEQKVPATSLSRFLGFAALGANLAAGTAVEALRRTAGFGATSDSNYDKSIVSAVLTERNADVLAKSLCRMRGAALKIGQMLSIQDEAIIPPNIAKALDSVRQGADMMPKKQLQQQMTSELGGDWREKVVEFDEVPVASASIGQVHRGVLPGGDVVAMKIQYPGVAESIESDLANLRRLITYADVLPRGLYIDNLMQVAKVELSMECDYNLEAKSQMKFKQMLSDEPDFYIPTVYGDLSTSRLLTTEFVHGVSIDGASDLDQETRNWIGRRLLKLCIKELFEFRFMQTDPNFGNFLFDADERRINLIDFGAARDYPKPFVDDYLRVVYASANGDRDTLIDASRRLGFLTEDDSKAMLDAHAEAGVVVGEPFAKDGIYDFGSSNITHRLNDLGKVMLKHRLTPPPSEAYSLHRKLAGAFLICIKLRAAFPCRDILEDLVHSYDFGEGVQEGEVEV